MAKYKLVIASISSSAGQGLIEGQLDVRVRAQVVSNDQELVKLVPGPADFYNVKPGGPAKIINAVIGELTEPSTPVFRTVLIDVVEVDQHEPTLGQDDYGSGQLTFELKPTMKPTSKSITMPLYRPNMPNPEGNVKVTILAERLN